MDTTELDRELSAMSDEEKQEFMASDAFLDYANAQYEKEMEDHRKEFLNMSHDQRNIYFRDLRESLSQFISVEDIDMRIQKPNEDFFNDIQSDGGHANE